MSERLLLGVDEGTTGVKAALFDEEPAAGRARRAATRSTATREEGWVEQDGEEVLAAVVEAIGELLEDPPGEVVACGLDHQGESVLAWDAESGEPAHPDRRLAGQALAGGPRPPAPTSEEEVQKRSGLPFDPYFSAAKLAWLLENDDDVGKAREAGTLRMGTVDSFLCDRLGAGFATDASTISRTQLHALGTPGFDPWLCELFGVPPEVLPEVRDTAGELGTLRHEAWPVELPLCGQTVDQQAALAGAGCVVPGPRQGHLRHRRVRPRPRRRRDPQARPAACSRRSRGGSTAAPSTRSTAGCSPPGRCSSGCATSWASPRTRPRSESWRARPRDRPGRACCQGWRGSARRGGAPKRAP